MCAYLSIPPFLQLYKGVAVQIVDDQELHSDNSIRNLYTYNVFFYLHTNSKIFHLDAKQKCADYPGYKIAYLLLKTA
jgi:hypothetical protein